MIIIATTTQVSIASKSQVSIAKNFTRVIKWITIWTQQLFVLCKILGKYNIYDELIIGLRVLKYCLSSLSRLTSQTPASGSSDFVNHSYDFRFSFLFCPCWWHRRLDQFDRTVSGKTADWTEIHLATSKFLVRSLFILNIFKKKHTPLSWQPSPVHNLFSGLRSSYPRWINFYLKAIFFLCILRVRICPKRIKNAKWV